jgi:hypothetical protein
MVGTSPPNCVGQKPCSIFAYRALFVKAHHLLSSRLNSRKCPKQHFRPVMVGKQRGLECRLWCGCFVWTTRSRDYGYGCSTRRPTRLHGRSSSPFWARVRALLRQGRPGGRLWRGQVEQYIDGVAVLLTSSSRCASHLVHWFLYRLDSMELR